MNQVTGQETYKGTPAKAPEEAAKPATPAQNSAQPAKEGPANQVVAPRAFTEADLVAFKRFLLTGQQPVTTRGDLVEMHKRFVQMFETLNKGIGEMYVAKAEKDREALSERLDVMESAVDRMEGALRIEFEPALRAAMADVIAESSQAKRRWVRGTLIVSALILGGILVGALFQGPILETVFSIVSGMETQFGNFKAFLSPNGGI
jgi:hypothetical protein